MEGHNDQQGSGEDNRLWKGTTASKVLVEATGCARAQRPASPGGDNWLWKGTTARKVLAETVGCGSAQRSARVRQKKSYTAIVGKGPAEEVL